jgi:hypothetical protein
MLATLSTIVLALNFAPAPAPTLQAQEGCGGDCGGNGGFFLGIDLGGDIDLDVDVDLGDCLGVDVELGANCVVLAGVDALVECNPLSVEAACLAELGVDCGLEAFVACTAELTAHCQAEVLAGGALFCDGAFIGADICLGGLDVDVNVDADACVDIDLGGDVDLDIDLDADICLDLDLDVSLDCEVEVDAACHAKCDPIAVEAACYAELGADCEDLHAFAACQADVIANCHAQCDLDGALFCDGDIYAGADICIDVGLGICLGL